MYERKFYGTPLRRHRLTDNRNYFPLSIVRMQKYTSSCDVEWCVPARLTLSANWKRLQNMKYFSLNRKCLIEYGPLYRQTKIFITVSANNECILAIGRFISTTVFTDRNSRLHFYIHMREFSIQQRALSLLLGKAFCFIFL